MICSFFCCIAIVENFHQFAQNFTLIFEHKGGQTFFILKIHARVSTPQPHAHTHTRTQLREALKQKLIWGRVFVVVVSGPCTFLIATVCLLGHCVTKLISEFRSYRNTKFSAPEFPELNGTNTVVPNSENFRENYRNCYRNSGTKPLSKIIPEPKPLSKIILEIPFFLKIPVYYSELLLRIKNVHK